MGQIFTVVIEGEFDGEYYLSATNPSSSTPALKGIIFKHGSHFNVVMLPYNNNNNTTDNVAALGVPLVQINVVPLIPIVLTPSKEQVQNPLPVPKTVNIEDIEEQHVVVNKALRRINESDIIKVPKEPTNYSCKSGSGVSSLEKNNVIVSPLAPPLAPLLPPDKSVSVMLKHANLSTRYHRLKS